MLPSTSQSRGCLNGCFKAVTGHPLLNDHTHCCQCLSAYDLFRDRVYQEEDWRQHRSWKRHFPNHFVALQVVAWYWPPLVFVAGIGVLAGVYYTWLAPRGWPALHTDLTVPLSLTSFALALLMVFRTNSSYDRWWEARKLWGGLLGTTRTLARQGLAWGAKGDAALKEGLIRWIIAYVHALHAHVTPDKDLGPALRDVLLPEELQWLQAEPHKPTGTTMVLTEILRAMQLTSMQLTIADEQVTALNAVVAACERLYRQPIPVAYTRHTSRFLVTWMCFMPVALWRTYQWVTPAASVVVAFLLIGVENIGVQIEQPFQVLPLATLVKIMRTDALHALACHRSAATLVESMVTHPVDANDGSAPPSLVPPMSRDRAGPRIDRAGSAASPLYAAGDKVPPQPTPSLAPNGICR